MLLLLPLPLIIYCFWPAAKPQTAALRVPHFQRWSQYNEASSAKTSAARPTKNLLLLTIIWALIVIASAGPIWQGEPIELPSEGRELMIAVDLSGSMAQTDIALNGQEATRLDIVKNVLTDFIERRKGDKIGLILFGSQAYLQAPLTFDRKTVATLLDEAQLGFAGKQTAIGDAIGLSIKRLQNRPAESRVVILLTDGENNAGAVDPMQAAKKAADNGLTVYTVGIGAGEMVQQGAFGGLFGNRTVNPSADLDRAEASLQRVADLTGGRYFRAKNRNDLMAIYQLLDKLEPIEQQGISYRPQQSLFFWPLGAALVLSLLAMLINLLREKMLPEQETELVTKHG
jgi:Ca-activated chloride channel family protein